jgi:hypothetical protein
MIDILRYPKFIMDNQSFFILYSPFNPCPKGSFMNYKYYLQQSFASKLSGIFLIPIINLSDSKMQFDSLQL